MKKLIGILLLSICSINIYSIKAAQKAILYFDNLPAKSCAHIAAHLDAIEQKIRLSGDRILIQKLDKIAAGIPLSHAVQLYKTAEHASTQSQFKDYAYSIAVNETWFYAMSTQGQQFLLCHEVMHIILEHIYARVFNVGNFNAEMYNKLCIAQEKEADLYAIKILGSANGGLEYIHSLVGSFENLNALPQESPFAHPSYQERYAYFIAFNQAHQAQNFQA